MRAIVKSDRGIVSFTNVEGVAVANQPWPQTFHVSRTVLLSNSVELRPLTFTSFVKGVARNFVTMNFWRLCWTLRGLGFLNTPEAGLYSWRQLTFRFWKHQQVRRFKWVRSVSRHKPMVFSR